MLAFRQSHLPLRLQHGGMHGGSLLHGGKGGKGGERIGRVTETNLRSVCQLRKLRHDVTALRLLPFQFCLCHEQL